jgi:hypothetical protein
MKKVLDSIRWFAGLVMPMFARPRDVRSLNPAVRWTLHVVILATILIVVTVIFNVTELRTMTSPGGASWVRAAWPALLLLALYTLCWLGWWIYQILMEPPPVSEFPDIDAAWEESLRALDGAGIDLTEAPLFLVLGRPEASEEGLFEAAQLNLKVHFIPRRPEAPLHVYANRDGIYVTCAGASELGFQTALLVGEAQMAGGGKAADRPSLESFEDDRSLAAESLGYEGRTNDPREIDKWMRMKEILARARHQGRGPNELTPEEARELESLEEGGGSGTGATDRARPLLHRSNTDVERCQARLQHLCRLLVRDRRPYCPVNGVLVLLPLASTDSDELSGEIAACVQEDLATVRSELRVNTPIFSVMCDLDRVPGYDELTARLPKPALSQRMGQRFPFAPEIATEEIPSRIESSIRHIGDSFFPTLVSNLWRIEESADGETAATHENAQLFRFLSDIRERQRRLARINARAMARDFSDGPLMYGGCYLAGMKREAGVMPAFVRGIFQRIAKHQEDVSWNRAALADDARCDRLASTGFTIISILGALFLVAAVLILAGFDPFGSSAEPPPVETE